MKEFLKYWLFSWRILFCIGLAAVMVYLDNFSAEIKLGKWFTAGCILIGWYASILFDIITLITKDKDLD